MRILLFAILFIGALPVQGQSVVFGEKHPLEAVNSIFFDKDGMIYPDVVITNKSLRLYGNSLVQWYSYNKHFTDSLLTLYGLPNHKFLPVTGHGNDSTSLYTFETLQKLNDALIAEKSRQLDSIANGNGLEFYIHGFRKSYHENGKDVTSVTEFGYLTASLDSNRTRENLVVRVYWDGTYDCCFSKDFKKNKELFQLFQKAGKNANNVSASFTKMLEWSASDKINVVAHSLGTKIAVQGILNCKNPTRQFNVCLIAPAISGKLISDLYSNNSVVPYCSWLVFYNKKDFVLKKKDNKIGILGPGAYKYEVTTLGCNKRNDAKKLKSWMSKNRPGVKFELVNKTNIGKCHSLRCYTKNQHLIEVSNFLEQK